MKKSAYLFGLLFTTLALFLTACGSTSSKQSMARIEGFVLDQFSQAPIDGANISIEGTDISSSSDADGFFRLDGLESGSYRVVLRKDGYELKNAQVSVTEGSSSEVSFQTSMRLDWEYIVTDRNHTLGILSNGSFNINGVGLQNGDIIGVFYLNGDSYKCGGRIQRPWNGNSTAIAAYGDDTFTEEEKDGFDDGETFVWVLQKPDGTSYRLQASYEEGNNAFVTNGISKVIGLSTN